MHSEDGLVTHFTHDVSNEITAQWGGLDVRYIAIV